MSFKKRWRKKIKKVFRKRLSLHARGARVLAPVLGAAAGFFAGPVGAAAVSGLIYGGSRYAAAAGARGGYGTGGTVLRGREARDFGRDFAKRSATYSMIGGAVGSVVSGITSLAMGGNFFAGAGLGQGGSALTGIGGSTIFGAVPAAAGTGILGTAGTAGAAALTGVGAGVPGMITGLPGVYEPNGPMVDKERGGFDFGEFLEGIGGAIGGGGSDSEGGKGNNSDGNPFGGWGLDAPGGKGEGGGLLPFLIIGGVLLASAA